MINDFFDKIYCINIDRRTDRWEKCLIEFEKHGLNVERFSAIDGNTENYNLGYPYDNELAGSISHLNLIKKVKELNLKNVLILEDDVEFVENANDLFDEYVKQLPEDWYGLHFGGNHVYGLQRTPQPNIVRMNRSYAIHAYALNSNSFDILIEYLTKKINDVIQNGKSVIKESVAADYFIADLHRILNFYCFVPHIAWQKDDYSDIQRKNVNYNFLR